MTARPLPARHRSIGVAVRAAGAMALAMVLASCSLLNGGDKNPPEAATAKADPSIVASAPAGWRSSTRRKSCGSPAKGNSSAPK